MKCEGFFTRFSLKYLIPNSIMTLQQRFLNSLKDLIPARYTLVDELAEVLNISTDSAYRRLRGETALSIDEIAKLCEKYKLSFDAFLQSGAGSVTFQYTQLSLRESFRMYLQNIHNTLQMLAQTPNAQIIYAADDIPILHQFHYPEHAAFKMFYWMQSVLQEPTLIGKKFSREAIGEDLLDLSKQIYDLYCKIPSIEIWTDESAGSTLKQIAYYWEAGLFASTQEAKLVCEQFLEMLDLIQRQAEQGSKDAQSANYQVYQSEIQVGNNCILVRANDQRITFVRHQTFNIMHTYQPSFCADTEVFLQNMIKKSILISGVSEKQRYQFFRQFKQKMEQLVGSF
jgi:BetR domain